MKTRLLIFCLALSSSFMVAQTKLADKFFGNYGYVKATELYKEAYDDGDDSKHVLTRLGDCYYNNSDAENAAKWYGLALDKYNNVESEYIFKYIQSLKSMGKYQDANDWLVKYKEMNADDTRVQGYSLSNLDVYEELKEADNMIVDLQNLPINTANSDFAPYVYDGVLYYASANDSNSKKLYSWNKEPFLDIYMVSTEDNDTVVTYGTPKSINAKKLNTDYHEATLAITNDGQTMYFTRDNLNKRNRLGYDEEGTTYLKMYRATYNNADQRWDDIIDLPFNDKIYSTGHPALSPDGKQLYFVSDREGGLGKTDIYVVDIMEDGTYSEPRNLGPQVNTEGREMFPFVSKDSTLYFSSDGHLNLGLLDIFKSDMLKDENAEPVNMGAPYNSGDDDFAYFVNSSDKGSKGYFSSNRPGGKGNDDIYGFNAYVCQQIISGVTRDKLSNEVVPLATVRLIDEEGKVIEELTSDENGEYQFEVDCNQKYVVIGTKEDYREDRKDITTDDEHEKVHEADLYLEPLVRENQVVLNPIFFDFDKWNIRTDAEYELENLVDVLRNNPEMVIKIESHTDSRGSDRYNMKLSDRRAKSTRDYILSRGIDEKRIESAIGYGETQLLNECSNGVKCTKEQHQLNRRSYFYILEQ